VRSALGGLGGVVGRVEDVGPSPIAARPLDCDADLGPELRIVGHEDQRLPIRADLDAGQLLAQPGDHRCG
jgi:hypothetical protein